MKSFLYLILFFVLSVSLYAADADEFVARNEEGVSLKFKVISEQEKTAMATGLAAVDELPSNAPVLTIPATANGYAVVSVGEKAFMETPFESVVISEGVRRIEDKAFFNCGHTKRIKLPSTIDWLGQSCFICEQLEEVVALMADPVEVYGCVFDEYYEIGTKHRLREEGPQKNGSYLYRVYEKAVLYVPAGTKNKYQSRIPWGLFEGIRELSPDGDITLPDISLRTSFDMFSRLKDTKTNTDNICFSPLSAQIALSMVKNGADGNTHDEMCAALGTAAYSDVDVNTYTQSLITSLTNRPPFNPEEWRWWSGESDEEARMLYDAAYPVCEIANSVWHRPDVTLYASFTDILKASYDAGFGAVWFNTDEGIGEINRWVDDKTHGLIPQIYDGPQSDELAVVLADAIYFKGTWKNPFDKNYTQPGMFHLADGTAVQTDMMRTAGKFRCTESSKFRTVTLPYGNGDYSMTLFVPQQGADLPELTCADWLRTVNDEHTCQYFSLSLPRFSFDGKHDLVPVLKDMGVNEAFGTSADFSRMTDSDVFINKVYQLSDISVDEEGTEAAAVTVVEIETTSAEPDPDSFEVFLVNRPFYFTIENNKEQTVLFVGRVATVEVSSAIHTLGDVNGDGEVDISDIVTIINVMAGTDTNAKADVNLDGKPDIADVVSVINIIAGKETDEAVKAGMCPDTNHPHAIDLGIGVKFACCNVGASAPWEYGGYYSWGETEEKDSYSWDDYLYREDYDSYQDIGDDISGTDYDIAQVKWGGGWHLPTADQTQALIDNCSSEWIRFNGVDGRMFYGRNGRSLFLPAAGMKGYDDDEAGGSGHYWLSTTISDEMMQEHGLSPEDKEEQAGCLHIDWSSWTYNLYYYRECGLSVRPVVE